MSNCAGSLREVQVRQVEGDDVPRWTPGLQGQYKYCMVHNRNMVFNAWIWGFCCKTIWYWRYSLTLSLNIAKNQTSETIKNQHIKKWLQPNTKYIMCGNNQMDGREIVQIVWINWQLAPPVTLQPGSVANTWEHIRAWNENSRILKFFNHREGPC